MGLSLSSGKLCATLQGSEARAAAWVLVAFDLLEVLNEFGLWALVGATASHNVFDTDHTRGCDDVGSFLAGL